MLNKLILNGFGCKWTHYIIYIYSKNDYTNIHYIRVYYIDRLYQSYKNFNVLYMAIIYRLLTLYIYKCLCLSLIVNR